MENKFDFNIKINPLNPQIEKMVCAELDFEPTRSYEKISEKELDKIYFDVCKKFSSNDTKNFDKKVILSIRANYMRAHMMHMHKYIQKKKSQIIREYVGGASIKSLVKKYDGSPLNIIRLIFQEKYKAKLTSIISNPKIIKKNSRDLKELEWAIDHDTYALINQDEILAKSTEFEEKIAQILDKHKIKYKTQAQLAQEQIELADKPINTPDFLILSDLRINNNKITWIDAKNFYGAKSNFTIKKIKAQTKKYLDVWGPGSIVFSLGFNSELSFDNILLIDYESYKNI